jgi:ribosomal-protein-alanine N-acetyltransferase
LKPKEVKLRELHLSDKSQLAKLANSKNIWFNLRDTFPYPYSESDAEFFINSVKEEKPKQNFGI